jgi:hypothetical protein
MVAFALNRPELRDEFGDYLAEMVAARNAAK